MNLARRIAPTLAAAMLSACVAPSRGPETATPGAGGTTHCGQFENVSVADNQYVVQTNEWNSTQTQCVRVTATGFAVTEANFGLPTAGPPASYPSIFKGCHWGNCTNGSGMPVQVASLPAVKSGWTVVAPESGAYDIAYDLWFNQTPTTSGQPNGTELMIWIRHAGGVRPAGSQVGTVSLAGAAWDVWKGKMPSWTYVAYVRQAAADAVDLDLRAFVEDAVARGTIDPSWYMVDIEAGFEIWQGGRGLATSSFSAVVGGPSRI